MFCCCSKFHLCPVIVANSGSDLRGSKLKNTIGMMIARPILKGCHLNFVNNRLLSELQGNVHPWNPPSLRHVPTMAMSGLCILYLEPTWMKIYIQLHLGWLTSPTLQLRKPDPMYLPEKWKYMSMKRLIENVYRSNIHHTPRAETTQMSIHRTMDKLWSIQTMEPYLAKIKNLLIHIR